MFASACTHPILGVDEHTPLVGTPLMRWIHPSQHSRLDEHMRLSLESPGRGLPGEYQFTPLKGLEAYSLVDDCAAVTLGQTVIAELFFTPWLDTGGQVCGLLATVRDVTASKQVETRLQQNLDQQRFFNHLLQLLYRPVNLRSALVQVLELTGVYTQASHVFLAENATDGLTAHLSLEWFNEDAAPRSEDVSVLQYRFVPSFKKMFDAHGALVISDLQTLPYDLANLLYNWQIHSLVAIPIYSVDDQLHGFVAFDDTAQRRSWSPEEQDLFRSISRALSSAVARTRAEEEERAQRVVAEVLRDVSSVLNSKLDIDDILDYILANLGRVIPNQAAYIVLLDDQGQLSLAHATGYTPETLARLRTDHKELERQMVFMQRAQPGKPLLLADTHEAPWRPAGELAWVRSRICSAIRARGQLLGYIIVDSATPHFFAPEHAQRLQAFADHAATAIDNAHLYQEARRHAGQMTTLYDVGLTLTSNLEMTRVLETLHEQTRQVLPNDAFYVALFEPETGLVEYPLFYEDGRYIKQTGRDLHTQPGLTGRVILYGKTLYLPDLQDPVTIKAYPMLLTDGTPTRSYLGVPLIIRDQVIGMMAAQSCQPNFYNLEQIRLLETIATQAAIALENARIFKQMKQLAITNSLTGLYTRRHFTALGQVELERAMRYHHALAVIMVDIDQFKIINDTHGHSVGDQVLQTVAQICRSALRVSDILGRYGGEEFAIVLPETTPEGAQATAERIRFEISASAIVTTRGLVQVTASLGLVILSEEIVSLETLLDHADHAMYEAKQAGRNQVKLATFSPPAPPSKNLIKPYTAEMQPGSGGSAARLVF